MVLDQILKDKKKKRWTIFILLIVILAVILYIQFSQPPIPEGAERVVYCTKCKTIGVKVIVDIDDDTDKRNFCKLCGGRLRYAVKCRHCEYEFPLSPITAPPPDNSTKTMDKFRYVRDREECPNCHVTPPDTVFIETDSLKTRKEL